MKKIFPLILLVAVMLGCKKDNVDPPEDKQTETTIAEDKQNIKTSFDQLSSCITQIRDSEGADAITDFLNLSDGDVMSEDWVLKVIDSLVTKLDFADINDNNQFNFAANAGTYTWDATLGDYGRSSLPTDKIIVIFPSKESVNSTNNSTLTLSGFDDTPVLIDGMTYHLPTAAKASLVVDGVEIFSVDATAAYSAPIPISLNVAVKLKPFTYTITGNRVAPTKFNAGLTINNGSGCNTSVTFDVEFLHSDYYTMDLEKDVKAITATLVHNNLKVVTVANMESLGAISDPTVSQINSHIKSNVYYGDVKVAELILYEEANDDLSVRIIYKDGSEENTSVYYEPFIENLETILGTHSGEINL